MRIEICMLPKEKEVTRIRYYGYQSTGYCVCPGCNCTFEREYQTYCDRCGQKLAWNLFSRGNVTLVKRIPCTIRKTEEISKEIELSKAAIP